MEFSKREGDFDESGGDFNAAGDFHTSSDSVFTSILMSQIFAKVDTRGIIK